MTRTEFISHVIREFYARATTDVLIGYHFKHIADFATHLPRIDAFWQTQLLGKTDLRLDPPLDVVRAHVPLLIKRGEVGRWVLLFEQTLAANAPLDRFGLTEVWLEKVRHFQQVFLQSPLLFPKA